MVNPVSGDRHPEPKIGNFGGLNEKICLLSFFLLITATTHAQSITIFKGYPVIKISEGGVLFYGLFLSKPHYNSIPRWFSIYSLTLMQD